MDIHKEKNSFWLKPWKIYFPVNEFFYSEIVQWILMEVCDTKIDLSLSTEKIYFSSHVCKSLKNNIANYHIIIYFQEWILFTECCFQYGLVTGVFSLQIYNLEMIRFFVSISMSSIHIRKDFNRIFGIHIYEWRKSDHFEWIQKNIFSNQWVLLSWNYPINHHGGIW